MKLLRTSLNIRMGMDKNTCAVLRNLTHPPIPAPELTETDTNALCLHSLLNI